MSQLMNGLYTYVTTFQPLVHFLIAIVLIIIGAMFILPFEETKNAAKKALPYLLIGGGMILCASQLATEFTSNFTFDEGAVLRTIMSA